MDLSTGAMRIRAAFAAVLVRPSAAELRLIHKWLDSWVRGGLIVDGMARQGYDAQFRQYP